MALNNYISLSNLTSFLNKLNNIFATKDEVSAKSDKTHTHAISDVTNLQSTLNGKASTSHGTHVSYSTTTPVMDGTASVGSASTVARSDHKHPTDTSRAAQTDLDALEVVVEGKANTSHTHNYAGSSSAGGAATSANKLNTNAGDSNTPVYFNNGVPVACTSLDLNTTGSSASCTGNAATATNVAWSGVTSKPSYYDAKAIKGITRSGTTFTYTCMDGTTGTFTQQDNNTTYSAATTSAAGLMSAEDKTKLNGIATGANKITVDSAMSTTSTNPVQNKVVKAAIDKIALTVNSDGVLMLSI